MTEPFYDFVLTDDQLKTVGMISLNWSIVEREITDILRSFYVFSDAQDSIDLVTVLDFDKKLTLCAKKLARDPKPSGYDNTDWNNVQCYLDRLHKSAVKFRDGRNYVIHGTVVRFFGAARDPAILSYKKGRTIELSELDKILDQSCYLTHVMGHLAGALYGWKPPQPLPDIPD